MDQAPLPAELVRPCRGCDGRQVLGVDSASASGEAGVAVVGVNVSASAGAPSGGTAAALTTGVAGSDATAGGVTATAASATGGAAGGAWLGRDGQPWPPRSEPDGRRRRWRRSLSRASVAR